jgi:hypothetical protein
MSRFPNYHIRYGIANTISYGFSNTDLGYSCVRTFSAQQEYDIPELNVQIDHIHLLVLTPLKISVSNFARVVSGNAMCGTGVISTGQNL